VNFAAIVDGDRLTKKEMSEATERHPELSLFAKWLSKGRLPIDSDELTQHDPVTKSLHAQWERFKSKEGVLYRKYWENSKETEGWQLVPPVKYRLEIINTAHSSVSGGHMGVRKMQIKVAKKAYWVGWAKDVCDFCRKCDACARYHRGTVKKQGELQNMCVGLHGNALRYTFRDHTPSRRKATNSW